MATTDTAGDVSKDYIKISELLMGKKKKKSGEDINTHEKCIDVIWAEGLSNLTSLERRLWGGKERSHRHTVRNNVLHLDL